MKALHFALAFFSAWLGALAGLAAALIVDGGYTWLYICLGALVTQLGGYYCVAWDLFGKGGARCDI